MRQLCERVQSLLHWFSIQHAGNVMGRKRTGFTATPERKLDEDRIQHAAGNFTKGVSVEEKEGCGAMAVPQKIQHLTQAQDLRPGRFPARAGLGMSF